MKKVISTIILSSFLLALAPHQLSASSSTIKAEEAKNPNEIVGEETRNSNFSVDTDDNFGPILQEIFVFNKEKGINLELLPTVSVRGWENIVDVGQGARDDIYYTYDSISWIQRMNDLGVYEWSLSLKRSGNLLVSRSLLESTYQTILALFYRDYQWGMKNSSGMWDQLVCHYDVGWVKNPWNIEPERPDVGLLATKLAGCNPR